MKFYDIESAKNPIFKDLLSLLNSKGIEERGQGLVFGAKPTLEIAQSHRDYIDGAIISEEMENPFAVERVYRLSPKIYKDLDVFGIKKPILLVKTPKVVDLGPTARLKGSSILIPFQDPSNVGALLRSAAAFGVNQIVLAPGVAHPFHPKSSRAASGNLFAHKYFRIGHIHELKNNFDSIIALDASGENISEFSFPKDFLLMPGVEGPGLSAEMKDICSELVCIPLQNAVESLNAMVAASIALFVFRSKNL